MLINGDSRRAGAGEGGRGRAAADVDGVEGRLAGPVPGQTAGAATC